MGQKKSVKLNIKGKIFLTMLGLVFVVSLAGYMYLHDYGPVDRNNTTKTTITIAPGSNAKQIINQLENEGMIHNKWAFQYYLKVNQLGGKLRSGDYLLSPSMTTPEIVDALLNGIGEVQRLTIPEGFTLRDIAETMEKENVMTADEFWDYAENGDFSRYEFLKDAPTGKLRLEGFLFPDTYIFAVGSKPEVIFKMMLDHYQNVLEQMPVNKSGLSAYDTLILASMIEAEAKTDTERATIASVYINRLAISMPMQCDATILYAMPERKKQLYYSDYEYESIYNTYLHPGLPPTPICNPGQKSLIAAYQPDQTEYLYYVWNKIDNNGHAFSKTYQEHLNYCKKFGY